MKNCFKLFAAALLTLALSVPALANETLTVCEGTNSSHYVPFSNLDFQSAMHSQLIYPADMLDNMVGQQINTVTFYLNGTMHADGGQLVVKMGETTKTVFASGSDFCTGLTQVAALPMTEGISEVVIELSSPYMYQGGNLVMDFTVAEAGDDNFYAWDYFYGKQQPSTQYTAIGSDGMLNNFLPKATFDYGVPQDWDAKVTPLELNFNVPAEREEVQTIIVMNKGLNAFTPAITANVAAPLSVDFEAVELTSGQSLEVAVKFAPEVAGEYNGTVTIDCGEAGSFEVPVTAVASDPVYEVTAADGTDRDIYLPFYGYYYDTAGTLGQMIYTEDMMGATKGNKITKVTFYPSAPLGFNGGQVQLSFKVVDQNGFEETTAITEMNAVATMTPVVDATVLEFVLDEPFDYTGGNLAIEAKVIESANYRNTQFYGMNLEYNPSYYYYVDYYGNPKSNTSTFLPKATFSYEKNEAPQFLRGDVDNNGEVKIGDVTALINYLLSGDASEINLQAADCDQNGEIKIGDVTALINYLLSGAW